MVKVFDCANIQEIQLVCGDMHVNLMEESFVGKQSCGCMPATTAPSRRLHMACAASS